MRIERYIEADFDQGEVMAVKGITDPQALEGVCLSLVILWARLFKKREMSPRERMYKLGKKITTATFYQGVLQDLWNIIKAKNNNAPLSEEQKAFLISKVSADQKIEVEHVATFRSFDPFCTYIENTPNHGIPHLLDVNFAGLDEPGTNHAIGLIPTPTKLIVFDPYLGEMHVQRGGNRLKNFGVDLWSWYLVKASVLDRQWSLFKMSGKGTRFLG